MRLLFKAQSLWTLLAYCASIGLIASAMPAQAASNMQSSNMAGDASRMVFKENAKNKKEPTCQLTLMHVYTSKFNKNIPSLRSLVQLWPSVKKAETWF